MIYRGSPSWATAIPKQVLYLDDEAWEVLTNWFSTTTDFDTEQAASSPAIVASALPPGQFGASAEALKYILESWYMFGLQVPGIQRDLLLLKCPPARIERLGSLLERLRPERDRVYHDHMRFEFENAVLPTLADMHIVCAQRPIFEDTVYPIPEVIPVRHTKPLGYSYVVLVELSTEDSGGRSGRLGFQMNERQLIDLQAALQRAIEQLDILKRSTRAIQTESTKEMAPSEGPAAEAGWHPRISTP
jgi:hypothetical protein